jgi:hypothetical protein
MIQISSIKFNNELRTTQDLNFLIACIGEKVDIKIRFYYEDISYCTEDNLIVIEPDAADIDLVDNTGIITASDGFTFKDTFVGDTIYVSVSGVATSYTVTEKFNNGMIRTSYAGTKVELALGTDFVYNGTPFSGLRYAYNFIQRCNSFNSLIDGEYQQAITTAADYTNTTASAMTFTGITSYQIGSVTIDGLNEDANYKRQSFELIHNAVITPFFLSDQYEDLLLGVKPDYFANGDCLNYIAKLSLSRYLNNPNGLQEISVPNTVSNIGWFNENFNGNPTNYVLSSLTLTDAGTSVDSLRFDTDIIVTATISNSVDTPFSSGNTKYIFGFNYLPESESDYQNNGENQTINFVFDSKINTLGLGSANGANYGTGMQVIKSVTSTYVSSSVMIVTATIRIGAEAKSIMQQGDYSRYQMWLITENHALSAANSNKVNLLLQVGDVDLQLTTTDLLQCDGSIFIQHPYESKDDAIVGTDLELYPVDDLVAYSPFLIDFTGHTAGEGIKINSIRNKIVLRDYDGAEADIILEDLTVSTAAYPIIAGQAQAIDFEQDRVFKIPTEVRKTIVIERDYDSDTTYVKYFKMYYPFMLRWEYWEALQGLTTAPTGIFDNTESLNGLNHLWYRFTTIGNWKIYHEVIFTIEQNGEQFTTTATTEIADSNNYEGNAEWGNETIKSYDSSNNELVSGGTKFVNGYENTKIVASFEKLSGYVPTVAQVGIVIWIHVYEQGGISSIRRISSFYETDNQTWFESTDTSNKVVVAKSGSTFTGQCYLDYTKLPTNSQYTIYARLYEFYGDETKQFEDGELFEFEDGTLYQFEF